MGNVCCVAGAPLRSELRGRRLGNKRVHTDGQTFAPFGMVEQKTEPLKVSEFKPSSGSSKEKVDLREYMTAVEDQAAANSCCANAVAGAYEYINKREALKRGDSTDDISRLFIYYVGRKRDQQIFGEDPKIVPQDEGMTLGGAITALEMKGACLEKNWPYNLDRVNHKPDPSCFDQALRYKIASSQKVAVDLDAMRAALSAGNPIVFGLKLTSHFFRPLPGGFIPTPDPSDPQSSEHGLHAMLLVGYNDRQQVFIVRNSWGTSWADRGYAYVPYDYIANSAFNFLDQYVITGLTDTDFTPADDDGNDFSYDTVADSAQPELVDYEEEAPDAEPDDFDPEDEFDWDKETKRVFDKFDVNSSGTIELSELATCLSMNGVFMLPWQIEDIMKQYESDGKPGLSFEEFKLVCQKE
ncbi:unnamed protein product [Symbiodinium natans]|uniref:EF-hand domain-containing protein n=1 Tax=Symbiodinium natans TaxID=878477 RepID=A0A812RAQ1_9DINO|nr:unnamed protein product [Symbiodinium natans]